MVAERIADHTWVQNVLPVHIRQTLVMLEIFKWALNVGSF